MSAPPATSRAPRLSKQQRQAQVLDTAARLFYARGVHEVGMDEPVRATGLGKATVYRLYPTKDALVAAYLRRLATAGRYGTTRGRGPDDNRRAVEWYPVFGLNRMAGAAKAYEPAEASIRFS